MSWKWLKGACVIGLTALIASGCSTSSKAVMSSTDLRATEARTDSVKEEVMVAVHDTIMEVTTITVDRNEIGDTLRMTTVTDRLRIKDRDAIAVQKTKTEVRVDTVYIEKRDSIEIRSRPEGGQSQKGQTFLRGLKWIFWIVIALMGFVIVIKVFNVFR